MGLKVTEPREYTNKHLHSYGNKEMKGRWKKKAKRIAKFIFITGNKEKVLF